MQTAAQPEGGRILVVEDDRALRELLAGELRDAGHNVEVAGTVNEARQRLEEAFPDLVISDLRLPDDNGLVLLEAVTRQPAKPGFIIITAFGTIAQAVDALKRGADDFITKPLDLDHLRVSVRRTLQRWRLQREVAYYRRLLGEGDFHGIIGHSAPMRRLFVQLQQVARASGPVLITGESGVGKELVARAVHEESTRADKPFIAVNCAGIPQELLESELFGHAAGAFTGAAGARKGLFAEADGGTLLLDEIGEMPEAMQSSLLRILEDGRVRPVGANREQQLDVRIIAATNRRLDEAIEAGEFREDLYYRLETFSIEVPPLRERGDDIQLLTAHFIDRFGTGLQTPVRGIRPRALEQLNAYPFPGNVRELSNVIERAVAFCGEEEIDLEHLPERIRDTPRPAGGERQYEWRPVRADCLLPLEAVERDYIRYVLEQAQGNKRRAADILGIGRRTLYRRLEQPGNDD